MIDPIFTYTGSGLLPAMDPASAVTNVVTLAAGVTLAQGTVLGQVLGSGTDVNEVQTLTFSAVGSGTFLLVYDNEYTTPIAVGATAATVQAAMEALPSIGVGNCTVTGGPAGSGSLVFTFAGSGKTAGRHHPLLQVVNSTNGTLAVTLTTLGNPAGGYWDAYSAAAAGVFAGLATARQLLQYNVRTNSFGHVYYGTEKNLADHRHFDRAAPAYFAGTFRTADLVGIDATAVGQLGVLIAGSTAVLTNTGTILRMG